MSKKLEKAIELLLKAKERGCPFTAEEDAEILEVADATIPDDAIVDPNSLDTADDGGGFGGGRDDGRG